jgi:hypothetical protein
MAQLHGLTLLPADDGRQWHGYTARLTLPLFPLAMARQHGLPAPATCPLAIGIGTTCLTLPLPFGDGMATWPDCPCPWPMAVAPLLAWLHCMAYLTMTLPHGDGTATRPA